MISRRILRRALSACGLTVTMATGCNAILGNDDGFLKDASVNVGAAGEAGASVGSGGVGNSGGLRNSGGLGGAGGARASGGAGDTVDSSSTEGSSTGGSSSSADAGPEAAPPACSPSQTRCSTVPNALETCGGDGQWGAPAACPYVCANDKCGGVCTPDDKQCDGKVPQTCGSDGVWRSGAVCNNVCALGACVDVCMAGTRQCSNLVPQRCEGGVWVPEAPCPYLCKAGSCSGVCSPNANRCTSGVQETCDAAGSWMNPLTCPFPCAGSLCGACAVNDTRCNGNMQETCTSANAWSAGTACPNGCIGKTCAVCVPSAKRCTSLVPETCGNNGQWSAGSACPFVCKDGGCVGTCVPNTTRCMNGTQETCTVDGAWGMSVPCTYGCAGVVCARDLCTSGDCTAVLRTVNAKPMDGWANIDAPVQVAASDGIEGYGSTDGVPNATTCTSGQTLFKEAHWQLAGSGITPGTVYQVTFHVWGVVDCKTYQRDAAKCPQAPNLGRTASYNLWCPEGRDNASNYNSFMISVTPTSSATMPNIGPQNLGPLPASGNWWTLNECPTGAVEQHQTWKIDYDATIAVPGGSWINFVTFDPNCRLIVNCGSAIDSIGPCPAPYSIAVSGTVPAPPPSIATQPAAAGANGGYGQWVYFDVKTVHQ